jgi:hypothetical protein
MSCSKVLVPLLLVGLAIPATGSAQSVVSSGGGFVPGQRTIFDLDLSGTPPGQFPKQLKLLSGTMTVVQKDGMPMLKASEPSQFLIVLPELLPPDFTVEFELIPKAGGNPNDLQFEGTEYIDQGVASARISWDPEYLWITGGGPAYQANMPEDVQAGIGGGVHVKVNASFDGGTVKLFTGDKRNWTQSERQFVRGRMFRVELGGTDGGEYAVHLAHLRIATNTPAGTTVLSGAGSSFTPGKRTLFDLRLPEDQMGEFPKQVKLLNGEMSIVNVGGVAMLRATKPSQFLVTLPEVLPQDFTVEFQVIPKSGGNPDDLTFEGTATIDQGAGSARIGWDGERLAIVGGGAPYETPMPPELGLISMGGVPTDVNVSFEGGTVKLFTGTKRLYTLTDRKFAHGKVFRVELGGTDSGEYAVYLSRLRIATNAPAPTAGTRP